MNLILFLYIASFITLTLGEFGQFPFGQTQFSISVADILTTLSLTGLLIWNIGIKKNLKIPRNFIFLMVFWAIGFLSLSLNFNFSGGFYLFRFIVYSSLFYVVFHLIKSKIFALDEFLKLVTGVSLVLAISGLIQLIIFPDLEILSSYGYDPHKYRIFSTFLDPNYLGTFLSFGLVFKIYDLIRYQFSNWKDLFKEKRYELIYIAILSLTIILTFSRSAYLILFTSLFIVFAATKKKMLLGLIGVVVILFLIFPAFNERIIGALSIDDSASERFSSWEKGVTIFSQNPLIGVGFNNIRQVSQNLNLVKTYSADGGNSGAGVDSSLLFILATTGLIGFICFVIFLMKILIDLVSSLLYNVKYFYNFELWPVVLRRPLEWLVELPKLAIWERIGKPKGIKPHYLSLPLFALTVGLILNSFFINSFFYPSFMFLWYSTLGVFLGSQPEARTPSSAYGLGEGAES